MKKIITGALLLCMVLSFTGCQFNYEKPSEMLEKFEGWAENLGQSQITEEENLIGNAFFLKTPMSADTLLMVRMRQVRMLSSEERQLRNAN